MIADSQAVCWEFLSGALQISVTFRFRMLFSSIFQAS